MSRLSVLAVLLSLSSALPAQAEDRRESVRRYFEDPVLRALDGAERTELCGHQDFIRSPRIFWVSVDEVSVVPAADGARDTRVRFHPVGWSSGAQFRWKASPTEDAALVYAKRRPEFADKLATNRSGLLAVYRFDLGPWIADDILTPADLAGTTDLSVGRSEKQRANAERARAAAARLAATEARVLSEPARDRLRAQALFDLAFRARAVEVLLAGEPMSAIERWRDPRTRNFRESLGSSLLTSQPTLLERLRAEAIDEQERAIRSAAGSEAEAEYRIADLMDRDPDGLFARGDFGHSNIAERMARLDRALAADPNHAAALRLKLELLVGENYDAKRDTPSAEDVETTARRLAEVAPADPLPAQVLFAERQRKVADRDGLVPPDRAAVTRPEGVSLDGLQAAEADLSGMALAGADLSRLWVRRVRARGTDLRGVEMTPKGLRPPRVLRRFLDDFGTGPFARSVRFDWTNARADGAHFADLRIGAVLDGTSLRGAQFAGVEFDTDTEVSDVDFRDAHFTSVRFDGTVWHSHREGRAIVVEGVSDGAWFGVDFSGARFESSSIRNVEMVGTRFDGADLGDTRFDGVTFRHVDFTKADLGRATFGASLYDCATRFPRGYRPDAAGLVASSDRCDGIPTPRHFVFSGDCRFPPDFPLPWGSVVDVTACEIVDLPHGLRGVTLRGVKPDFFENGFYETDLTDADLTGLDDGGRRWRPGMCEGDSGSLANALVRAARLDRARLAGRTLQLFDVAAGTVDLSEADFRRVIRRLARADLRGAVLACGVGAGQLGRFAAGWHAWAAAAAAEQMRFLSVLRRAPGVIVDETCKTF